MKLCIAGEGAFGKKHIEAIANIADVQIDWLIGGDQDATKLLAKNYSIPNWSCVLDDALDCNDIDGVILATPSPIHAQQAKQVLTAGKPVLIEIPMADNYQDALDLVSLQKQMGVVAMAGHVRRYNPSHQWIHQQILNGQLHIQQLEVQTHFFRRENKNAEGNARSWTDHLLWHHACHTIDLFQYQTGQKVSHCFALQGPIHPELNIAMDMAVGLKVPSGSICNLSLSFNNQGPFGSVFRYICDNGTYVARYDELTDAEGNSVDLSDVSKVSNGIQLMDDAFIQAIRTNTEANASLQKCLSAMETLSRLEKALV